MKNTINCLMTGCLCFWVCCAVGLWNPLSADANEWRFYRQADLSNESGHRLRLDAHNNHQLRIWLILKHKNSGVFSEQLPVFKIDQGPVYQIASFKDKNIQTQIQEDRWILFRGKTDNKEFNKEFVKILAEFENGEKVIFQYYPSDGSIRETAFKLSRIDKIIDWLIHDPDPVE